VDIFFGRNPNMLNLPDPAQGASFFTTKALGNTNKYECNGDEGVAP
jgi:hypothetical protein